MLHNQWQQIIDPWGSGVGRWRGELLTIQRWQLATNKGLIIYSFSGTTSSCTGLQWIQSLLECFSVQIDTAQKLETYRKPSEKQESMQNCTQTIS